MQASVSRYPIRLLFDSGESLRGELVRHLAPLTVFALMNRMPIDGRIARMGEDIIYWPTDITLGAEKLKSDFKSGDMAFMPSNSAVSLFLKDSKLAKPIIPIGRIIDDVAALSGLKIGATVKMQLE